MPKNQVPRSKTLTSRGRTDTHTHRHTEVSITEYPIKASAFQASACDMSGPIYWRILSLLIVPSFCVCIVYVHLYVCCVCVFYLFFSSSCYLFIFQGDLVQRKCKNVPHNWSLRLRIYIFSNRFRLHHKKTASQSIEKCMQFRFLPPLNRETCIVKVHPVTLVQCAIVNFK